MWAPTLRMYRLTATLLAFTLLRTAEGDQGTALDARTAWPGQRLTPQPCQSLQTSAGCQRVGNSCSARQSAGYSQLRRSFAWNGCPTRSDLHPRIVIAARAHSSCVVGLRVPAGLLYITCPIRHCQSADLYKRAWHGGGELHSD